MAGAAVLSDHVSKEDLVLALDVVDASLKVGSESQFRSLMSQLFDILPIEGADCCIAQLGMRDEIIRSSRRISINYPAQWVQIYRRRGYQAVDPVARLLFREPKPLIWSQLRREDDNPLAREFYAVADEFGLKDGFAYGARFDDSSTGSFFSCVCEEIAKYRRHLVLLEYLMPHIHMALARMRVGRVKDLAKLTPREREVLAWVKHGKTNLDISVLLGVTPRVVKFHIENAIKKLDVVNRTQAVTAALAQNLIQWS